MYYAAINRYAKSTSIGFANTWHVVGFETKSLRDAYVKNANDLATKSISAKEARDYGGKVGCVDYYDKQGNYRNYSGVNRFGQPEFI